MSRQSSSSYGGDTDPGTDRASSTTSSSIRWAPHGRGMTACLVVVNVVLVALVYIYFWRVFTRKPAATAASAASASNPMDHDHDEDASSSTASAPSSPPTSRDQHYRLVASLPPTFVARSGSGAGAECAVCIAELRDGDEGRALPRCGHHAPVPRGVRRRLAAAAAYHLPTLPGQRRRRRGRGGGAQGQRRNGYDDGCGSRGRGYGRTGLVIITD